MSETNTAAENRFKRREQQLLQQEARLNFWVKIAGMLVIITIFGLAAYGLYFYAQARNQPPRSYADLQLRIWKTQVAKNPKNPMARVNLGAVYYKFGNYNQALYQLNQALSLDKKNADAYLFRGRIYKKRGLAAKAVKDFQKSIKYSQKQTKLFPLYELGLLYEEKKKYPQAIKAYEDLIAVNPIFWNAHYHLAGILEKTGDKQRALSEYKEAAKFNPKNKDLQEAIKRLSPAEGK